MVGIPGCFGFFLLDELARSAQEESRRTEQNDIREVLGQVATRGSLQRRFGAMFDRLAQLPWTADRFARRVAEVLRADQRLLDVFVFDAQGTRVPVPGGSDKLVVASQQFMQALLHPDKPRREKLIAAFGGGANVPELMRATPGTLVELLTGGANTWGGWWTLRDGKGAVTGHCVAFVHRDAIDANVLLDRAADETNRLLADRFVVGWRDPLAPGLLRPAQRRFPAGLAECLDTMRIGESSTVCHDRAVAIYQHEDGPILFGMGTRAPATAADFGAWRRRLGALLICSFLLLAYNLHTVRSLRAKLLWQLAIAGGFPLAILLSTVFIDRQDREDQLQKAIGDRQLEYLAGFDGNFNAEMLPILRTYDRIFAATRRDPVRLVPGQAGTVRKLIERWQGLITQCVVVDARGKILLLERSGRPGNKQPDPQAVDIFPTIAHGILMALNGEAVASETHPGGNSVIGALVQGKHATKWIEENNILQATNFGKNRVLSLMRLYPDRHHRYPAVFLAGHDLQRAQIGFLRHRIGTRAPHRKGTTRLLAIPVVPGGSWPAFPSHRWGSNTTMRRLRDLVLTTGTPQRQVIRLAGEKFVASALRGHFLDGYVLVQLHPFKAITGQTRALTRQAITLSGAMLLFVLLVALVTARLLLRPLGELNRGLVALEARDFKTRVQPGHLAELAHVAQRFNMVLESLGELEMARSVQETLWPAHAQSGPGWRVDGRCETAAALGGDYYDWFVLADGRLVVAVGDVAGHGVPSALVAAAAKVELAMAAEVDADPGRILEAMHTGLARQAGRKRPMSFWVGILDPRTGTLHYGNAGQSFPIALIGDDAPRQIEGPGYPLASRKKAAFAVGALELGRRSRICLYSDGLVEAHSPAQEPFDYSRLVTTLDTHRGRPVDEAIAATFTAVRTWSGLPVPEDDQTLVILDWERSV